MKKIDWVAIGYSTIDTPILRYCHKKIKQQKKQTPYVLFNQKYVPILQRTIIGVHAIHKARNSILPRLLHNSNAHDAGILINKESYNIMLVFK